MRIASTITVTTAEVVVLIRNESGTIIMEKTLSLPIPERISEQMANIKVETLRLDKHEYRLARTVKKTVQSWCMTTSTRNSDERNQSLGPPGGAFFLFWRAWGYQCTPKKIPKKFSFPFGVEKRKGDIASLPAA